MGNGPFLVAKLVTVPLVGFFFMLGVGIIHAEFGLLAPIGWWPSLGLAGCWLMTRQTQTVRLIGRSQKEDLVVNVQQVLT